MKFLHIADLHLDRAFEGITAENLPDRTIIWHDIVAAAIENQVDFVILAGDNFHQSRPSFMIQKLFFDGLKKLEEKSIAVFLIFGNHDYIRKNQMIEAFPRNVYAVMGEAVETTTLSLTSGETVAISGFSYQQPWINESKASEFPVRSTADFHIGVYHGELGSANYAPFTLTELNEKNYDYWALGHIHVPTQLADNIYYSGTPLGHNRKETSSGVNLVKLTKTELSVEALNLAKVIWRDLIIPLQSTALDSAILEINQAILAEAQSNTQTIFFSILLEEVGDYAEELVRRLQSGELQELLSAYTKQLVVKIKILSFKLEQSRTELPLSLERLEHLIAQLDLNQLVLPLSNNKIIQDNHLIEDTMLSEIKEEIGQQLRLDFDFKEVDE
ncbi:MULTISPECIES: DNA repair exonuclease [unclassified Enterococcus]|uniref:metallophosphoesterase family protein n=1 Tax=unclassified Enterococcus TaxID=2608891 RepID=UPI001552E853|nr:MULTISPECIES: DNA repair exonuclease [unclassified Enterococcus]MBS7576025.1 DNA repair exonuclease [Enterococcus sp. MMGLQ5-2]MBS7583258.1 DNA repair exonuclease [Enterococcus sp. MMGLQ5-1]NPD11118.1 DNA repair exonuclease [Enterococcus sp. MMGLQ5-1]NPD35861.1 DNA repair exonuclease [Enterococcus sp. MMGLQ5-2]